MIDDLVFHGFPRPDGLAGSRNHIAVIPNVFCANEAALAMCIGGVYALENQVSDIWVFFLFGGIGWVMSRYGYPVQATVLGIILGPIMEENLRTSLMFSNGSLTPFFTKPLCLVIIVLTILSLWLSLRLNKRSDQFSKQK